MFTMKIDLADGEEAWRYSEFPLYNWETDRQLAQGHSESWVSTKN